MQVEQHIKSHYEKTKWPFIGLVEIINKFGEEGRTELNELHKDGKIGRREGVNGWLIELKTK